MRITLLPLLLLAGLVASVATAATIPCDAQGSNLIAASATDYTLADCANHGPLIINVTSTDW
jgi:hypothetical protein